MTSNLEVEVSENQSHSLFLVTSPINLKLLHRITLIANLDLHASHPSAEGVKVQAILAVCHSSGVFGTALSLQSFSPRNLQELLPTNHGIHIFP